MHQAMSPDLAIVIGHRASAQGAGTADGSLTEYRWSCDFVPLLAEECQRLDLSVAVLQRNDTPTGYAALPGQINALAPRFVISSHLNAFDSHASGSLVAYWGHSRHARDLAELLQDAQVGALGLRDRGVLPVQRGHRGWPLLMGVAAPVVIIEPGFISNPDDVQRLQERRRELAAALADACAVYRDVTGVAA